MNEDDRLFYMYEKPEDGDHDVELSDAWCVVVLILCVVLMFRWW